MQQTEQQKMSQWQRFTSLVWYDGFIEFLFRFVAKTSEPLLAVGLVVSAATSSPKAADDIKVLYFK